VSCAVNSGTSFTTCGLSCPTGYHATGYSCNFSCGSCGTSNNQTTCYKN
jgi:hypothetical protein